MALGTAKKEIQWSDEFWNSKDIESLREQQETDFGFSGPWKFKMPKGEGGWQEITSPTAKTLKNKIVGILSASWMKLFIDAPNLEGEDENKKERKLVSNTEQLANGVIWLADRKLTRVPSGKRLQSALVSDAVIRGGTVTSVLWHEEEKGKPQCDIRRYDPMYCQWEEGDGELIKFCYRNPVTKAYLERNFEKGLKGLNLDDAKNRSFILYTFWDEEQWKVAVNNEWVGEGKHGLGYIPVHIRSCGSVPQYQSEKYGSEGTLKWSWQSYMHTWRDIPDLESKLLSIEFSKALESGKIKIAGEWDSQASNNQPPEGLEKLGYGGNTRNEIILFDTAKGQKFGGMVEPPSNEIVERLLQRVDAIRAQSSMDIITQGIMSQAGSGVLAAELRASALEFITPFRECVEQHLVWDAEEITRQFKNGQFGEVEVEGLNSKRDKFVITLQPKDIKEKHFNCDLVSDRLRDKIQELGAAIQSITSGLTSRRTARIKHNIVEDPEREEEFIEQEKAVDFSAQDPVYFNRQMARYYKDQGTPEGDEMALYHEVLARKALEVTIAQLIELKQPGGDGQQPPPPPTITPQAEAGRIASEPEQLIRDAGA